MLLIVCKANITRSAYIEGYMKHCLKQQLPHLRRKVRVRSAGVQARGGAEASQVVRHVAQRNGFSLNGHRSAPLVRKLVDQADAILVMEQVQKEAIDNYFPQARAKTHLLTQYLRQDPDDRGGDIPDPTGLDSSDYMVFIDVAHSETDRILRELERAGVPPGRHAEALYRPQP